MVPIAEGKTAVAAWKSGVALLDSAPGHSLSNLMTVIANPVREEPDWLVRYNPMSVGANDRLSVVADVLFPQSLRQTGHTREQFYERHRKLLTRARKMKRLKSQWGSTYFERLLSLDGSTNQIERAIHALTKWGRKKAAIVAHLSSPRIDNLRTMGSPCLQYIEIL